jgi:dTDP-4-dehydrorhamnose reductase
MLKKKILILGAAGMLGHVLFKEFFKNNKYQTYGTTRSKRELAVFFSKEEILNIREGVDADNFETVVRAFAAIQPDVVINCIGIIKQLPIAEDALVAITVNAQLPHRLSLITRVANARLIHISTDCVFNGSKGNYTEDDKSDSADLYGRSKFLGEIAYPHCLTLRTSIIGHELKSERSLIDWFLSQSQAVTGFAKAIYSGFPTIELAHIISKYIIPNESISGVYHVSSDPISKYDLLKIVADKYGKDIDITPEKGFRLDRSLDSKRFMEDAKYSPPSWEQLIEKMKKHYAAEICYKNKREGMNV